MVGNLEYTGHRNRLDGFCARLREKSFGNDRIEVVETYNDYRRTYKSGDRGAIVHPRAGRDLHGKPQRDRLRGRGARRGQDRSGARDRTRYVAPAQGHAARGLARPDDHAGHVPAGLPSRCCCWRTCCKRVSSPRRTSAARTSRSSARRIWTECLRRAQKSRPDRQIRTASRLSKNDVFRTASRLELQFQSNLPLSARALQAHLTAVCIKTHAHVAGFYDPQRRRRRGLFHTRLRREEFFDKLKAALMGRLFCAAKVFFALQTRESKKTAAFVRRMPCHSARSTKRRVFRRGVRQHAQQQLAVVAQMGDPAARRGAASAARPDKRSADRKAHPGCGRSRPGKPNTRVRASCTCARVYRVSASSSSSRILLIPQKQSKCLVVVVCVEDQSIVGEDQPLCAAAAVPAGVDGRIRCSCVRPPRAARPRSCRSGRAARTSRAHSP